MSRGMAAVAVGQVALLVLALAVPRAAGVVVLALVVLTGTALVVSACREALELDAAAAEELEEEVAGRP